MSAEPFAALLAWLPEGGTGPAFAYEALRGRLVRLFAFWGSTSPEEAADETLSRAAARLAGGESVRTENRFAYLRGVARFVFLEELRRREREKAALRQLPGTHEEQGDDDDPRGACLEKCMAALDPDGRHLLLAYYQGQERERIERREQLAVKIGIGLGPLRNRVQRLREKVRACVDGCMRDTNPASETLPK